MTTPAATERMVFGQLARAHAKRYARHPLFLIGFANAIFWVVFGIVNPEGGSGMHLMTPLSIGVFGVVVAYRLTKTEDQALDMLPSTPTSPATRTLALCAAAWVPALAGAVTLVVFLVGWWITPPPNLTPELDGLGTAGFGAWMVGLSVVAGLGGPLLGVAVARWWRFRGAGVLTAFLIVVFALASFLLISPFLGAPVVWRWSPWIMTWGFTEGLGLDPDRVGWGPPFGHLTYQLGLCALAVWAAVIKDAAGEQRQVWNRRGLIAAVVALGGLWWAIFG